jgi:3-isopropylmalate/(R)-2-methylmalate dehydratase small subunit
MKSALEARAYVLGDDVDTDQIIPARHLTISVSEPAERARFGGLALTGVPAERAGLPDGHERFSDPDTNRSRFGVIVAGSNFGCGSSREHAPIALAEAGVRAVIARSYARIFYRNAVDGGYFPPLESSDDLTTVIRTGDEVEVDGDAGTLRHVPSGRTYALQPLGVAAEIIAAGGLFAYARERGMV